MRIFITFLLAIAFSSCGLRSFFKIREAMEQEKISPKSFKQEIPFRDEKGLIIIDVVIGAKVYNFIFDTGALTSIDDDIAESISYEKIGIQKHVGTSGKKEILKTIKLDSLSIGNIDFSSIVASITDLDRLEKKSCLNFDGIIGANVMNKAVWQIDYSRKIITLTDSRDSLDQAIDAKTINFNASGKRIPMLSLSVNNQYIGEGKFDTGSNGGFDLPEKDIITIDTTHPFIVRHGFSSGLFADRLESSKTTHASNLRIGSNFEIENTLVTFNKKLSHALIGNAFLRDYVVTIDWKYQEITFSFIKPLNQKRRYHTFGFTPNFKDSIVVIGSIYENSSADGKGLKIGDQIVQINDIDLRSVTHANYCDLLGNPYLKNEAALTITVKRAGREIKQTLIKQDLIEDILKNESR